MDCLTISRDVNHGFQIAGPHADLDELRRFIEAPEAGLRRGPGDRGVLLLTADWIEDIPWKPSKFLDRLDCWLDLKRNFRREG